MKTFVKSKVGFILLSPLWKIILKPRRRSVSRINGAECTIIWWTPSPCFRRAIFHFCLFRAHTACCPEVVLCCRTAIPHAGRHVFSTSPPKTAVPSLSPHVKPCPVAMQRDSSPPSDLGPPIRRSPITCPVRPLTNSLVR